MLQEQQAVAAASSEENEFLKRQVEQLREQLRHSDAHAQQFAAETEANCGETR
jgi:hypothetical protein